MPLTRTRVAIAGTDTATGTYIAFPTGRMDRAINIINEIAGYIVFGADNALYGWTVPASLKARVVGARVPCRAVTTRSVMSVILACRFKLVDGDPETGEVWITSEGFDALYARHGSTSNVVRTAPLAFAVHGADGLILATVDDSRAVDPRPVDELIAIASRIDAALNRASMAA